MQQAANICVAESHPVPPWCSLLT